MRSLAASRLAAIYLVVTAIGFGGTWVAAPWATDEIAPLTVATIRFALAAALLLGWCLLRGLPLRLRRADVPVIAGVALTSVAGYNVLFLYGVTLAPASHGAVLVPGLIPMATLVLSRLVLGTQVARRQVLGVLLSIAGLALVVGPELGGDARTLAGDAMFAVSAGIWAAYTLIGRASRLDSAVLTLYGTAVGSLVLLPLALLVPGGPGPIADASLRAILSVVYLGSIGTVLSFVTFLQGVRLIGAARASAYTVLIPVFGLTLTVSLLGEALTPLALVGAAIVLAGLRITQSTGREHPVVEPA
ncbi:MAG: DMT family transporter [Chloroflexi bacterium]|nr:DMT family transporter [Chloroflexota bacterium]